MKKFLLPLLLILITTGLVKAQINETFESGTATLPWNAADGKYLGVVNNPAKNAVNNSNKCIGYVKSDASEYSLFIATLANPINLTGKSKFKMQIYANRDAVTKFIFKLEGTGAKEFTKNIVVTKAWQEYTFDFSEVAANTTLTKVIYFFDPGVKTSKDTFYIDNIQQLDDDACKGVKPPTTSNFLDDFECIRRASYAGGWDSLSVVDNPSKTGINTSTKVGKFNDQAGTGTEYGFLMHHNIDPFDFTTNNVLRVKVLAPKAGNLLLKVEGGTQAKEVSNNITADQVGKWIEATADFSSVKFAGNTKLVMFFNAGANGAAGDVYYIDDIRFTEKPALEDFETTPKMTWAPLNNDNTLHGTFGGAVANPASNAVNTSATVGKYTKGTAVISTLTGALPTGFVLTTDEPQLNLSVYAPDANKTVQLQLVSATKGNFNASATVTAANAWEELKFDFSAAIGVTDISQIRVFFDPNTAASGKVFHFDNLRTSKLTINACAGVTKKPNTLDDFECQRNATYAVGAPNAIVNPKQGTTNASDKVGEYKDPKDAWSAIVIDNGANAIDLSKYNQLSVKIWSPTVVPLLFKLEGGTSPAYENPIFNVTKAGDWVTYKIDFSGQKGKNHKKVSIFMNAGVDHTTDDTYYIDDIEWKSEPISGCATDFETPITFTYFANKALDGKNPNIITNPKKAGVNTSAKVIEFVRAAGSDPWAGMFTDFPAPMKWLTGSKFVIRAKVLMDHIGTVTAKLEGAQNAGTNTITYHEINVANKTIGAWEEVTFDWTGKTGINPAWDFARLTLFVDLNAPVGTADVTSYIDDIVIGDGAGCGTSGIFDPVKVEKLTVFPNPASSELVVKNTQKIKRFEITNMLGQTIQSITLSNSADNQVISLENLSKGLYILSGYDEKGLIANSRFVKE